MEETKPDTRVMRKNNQLDEHARLELEKALRTYPAEVGDGPFEKEQQLLALLPLTFQRDRKISQLENYLEIVRWKSPRSAGKYAERDISKVRRQSRKAFEFARAGRLSQALDALVSPRLKGVGVRMATAILMFYDPDQFTVMDINAWLSLVHLGVLDAFECGWEETEDYKVYQEACHSTKRWFRHSLRDTDRALWTLGALMGRV